MRKLLLSVTVVGSSLWAMADTRPNFLVIMVDDMGFSDLGCYGSEIQTPNLDTLAASGIRYTSAHNTSKCFTSRGALVTGLYYQRTDREFTNAATFGEVLGPDGYRTLWSGKHHGNIVPTERGFDRYFGLVGGACNHWNPGKTARPGDSAPPADARDTKWVIDDEVVKGYVPDNTSWYSTDVMTDQALEWLGEYEDEDQPFFLYMAYTAPHYPLHAKPADIAKYDGVYDEGYDVIRNARYQRQLDMGMFSESTAPLSEAEQDNAWDELTVEEQADEILRMQIYAGMVDCVDQNIGRLITYLKSVDKFDNTLILFLSDNGAEFATSDKRTVNGDRTGEFGGVNSYELTGRSWANVSNTPFRLFKLKSHEGGIATPMIAHWPDGITQTNVFNHENCHIIDIMPTLMELSGATYPGDAVGVAVDAPDGVSLVPSFTGASLSRGAPLFYEYNSGAAIQDGSIKMVRTDEWELYDFSTNRTETTNIIDQHPDTAADMLAQWNAWYKECTGFDYGSEGENAAPSFDTDPVTGTDATEDLAYTGSLAGEVSDPNSGGTLSFSKTSGPDWLTVNADGALSGIPSTDDVGLNVFNIEVADDGDPSLSDTATLQITVGLAPVSGTLTLNPTDDTWVSSSETKLNTNYGGEPTLRVGNNAARESFLKFDVSGIEGAVLYATLRLYSTNVEQTVHCNALADTSWEEGTVTYNNRPSMGSTIDSVDVVPNVWNEFDVSSTINEDGVYAFGLEGTGSNKDFSSKDSSTNKPELVIVYESPAPTFTTNPLYDANAYAGQAYGGGLTASVVYTGANSLSFSKVSGPSWVTVAADGSLSGTPLDTDAGDNEFVVRVEDSESEALFDTAVLKIAVLTYLQGGTQTLNPTDDTWVTSGNVDALNLGSPILRVGKEAARESFLMFDVSGIGGYITSASLRLHSKDVAQTVHCNEVSDTTWDESSLNYGNRPTMGATINSVFTVADTWNEFDVASYVTAPGTYAFGLEGTAGNDDFYSKEADAAYRPELVIEYNGGFINVDQPNTIYDVTNGSNAMLPIASSNEGGGSGRDVLAVQGTDGVLVEFVAYDVAADGTIQLVLLGGDGQPLWDGSVNVIAGDRAYARFIVPGLELGADYDFIVRDETGNWWDASGVSVGVFAAEMVSASATETSLSFKSLPDHDYEIQWVEQLGDSWMPLDTVTATESQTSVTIPLPDPEDTSGFFRVELQ